MATANTPTPNTNILTPFDTFLEYIPSAILAIPENRRQKDSIIARKPAANNGNATTVSHTQQGCKVIEDYAYSDSDSHLGQYISTRIN
jgi:hypothetical protein